MITYQLLDCIPQAGRLGNNLWEIASTIGIATKFNKNFVFPPWRYSKYFPGLPCLEEVLNYPYKVYEEKSPYYSEVDIDPSQDWTLRGYFQSYKYFEHCKDMIKELLTPQVESQELNLDDVSIHVRRGDFLGVKHIHPVLEMDYYRKAMELFPGREFSIFSDDIEWCMDNFDHDLCTFILPVDEDIFDFSYMLNHKDHIIANSSFSWWAAYLGGGKVVAPKVWVTNENKDDRCPPDWIRI